MQMPKERLGAKFEVPPSTIDPARTKAYALATNDDNAHYASGAFAPPVFAAVAVWPAMVAGMGVIPPEAQKMVVHGERDIHFLRPLKPGMRLTTHAEAFSWRVGKAGTRYTIRIRSSADGAEVLDDYATMFVQKMSEGEDAGPDKPDHNFVEEARAKKVGEHTVRVDADQTYRYRDASGDDMRIHVDVEFAKKVGLPGIILHGLCTMAMNGRSVLALAGADDPARLRRLAVRWAKPVFPGNDLVTTVYDAGKRGEHHAYCFESASSGVTVVTNGFALLS